jgi:hypothetical protein
MNHGGYDIMELKHSDYKSYAIPQGVLARRQCYKPLRTNTDKVKKLSF